MIRSTREKSSYTNHRSQAWTIINLHSRLLIWVLISALNNDRSIHWTLQGGIPNTSCTTQPLENKGRTTMKGLSLKRKSQLANSGLWFRPKKALWHMLNSLHSMNALETKSFRILTRGHHHAVEEIESTVGAVRMVLKALQLWNLFKNLLLLSKVHLLSVSKIKQLRLLLGNWVDNLEVTKEINLLTNFQILLRTNFTGNHLQGRVLAHHQENLQIRLQEALLKMPARLILGITGVLRRLLLHTLWKNLRNL